MYSHVVFLTHEVRYCSEVCIYCDCPNFGWTPTKAKIFQTGVKQRLLTKLEQCFIVV